MATAEPKKITVTNNDQGPRYVFTAKGQEVVPAGGALATTASDAQLTAIKAQIINGTEDTPMFTVDGGDDVADAKEPLEGMSVTKLRALAKAEDVPLTNRKDGETDLPDLTAPADIAAAITAKRAANA